MAVASKGGCQGEGYIWTVKGGVRGGPEVTGRNMMVKIRGSKL